MTPWLLGVALLGCNGDDDGPTVRPTTEASAATGDTAVTACDTMSWESTGQPFVSTWCTSCHSSELAKGARFGAPPGIDFDSYTGVVAWADRIEATSVGPDARMPPVGGASDAEKERFGEWLACGLPGAPAEPDAPCADAVAASWGPAVCDAGDPVSIDGDVVADGPDGSCVCEVTGSLTVTGGDGDWRRLALVGGDLRVDGAELSAPALQSVGAVEIRSVTDGGGVNLSRLREAASVAVSGTDAVSLDLHDLRTVTGDVSVVGNAALTLLDLSRLETVGGSVVVEDNDALPAVLGELYGLRSVGGDLRIAGHASWLGFYGCGLLETVGGELQIVDNARFVTINGFTALTEVGGAIRIVSNASLFGLEGFDQLSEVGGDLIVSGNPVLRTEDAFALLVRVEGQVVVTGNPQLSTVAGLVGVEDVGGIVFSDVRELTSIGGYPNLTRLRGDLSVRSTGLTVLYGFDGIDGIDGSLVVESNPGLEAIAFEALRSVDGRVEIRNHPQLVNPEGLVGIEQIGGDLRLLQNLQLSEAGLQPWLDAVDVGGTVELSGNAP